MKCLSVEFNTVKEKMGCVNAGMNTGIGGGAMGLYNIFLTPIAVLCKAIANEVLIKTEHDCLPESRF